MATLDSLRLTRNNLQSLRIFHYMIGVMVLAVWAYCFFMLKIYAILFQVMLFVTICLNLYSIWLHTKDIKGLDDFIVFHTIRYLEKHDTKSKMIKFEKSGGFARKDIENLKQKQSNPTDWHIDETKSTYYLVEEGQKK